MHERVKRDRRIEEITRNGRDGLLGTISAVWPRETTDNDEDYAHTVNVITRSGGKELRNVPVLSRPYGTATVPSVDDFVLVEYLAGSGNAPVVTGIFATNEKPAPLAREGHWRHEFETSGDRLYLEAEPADHSAGTPDVARIATKEDGLSDPTTRIELDNSNSDPIIRLARDSDGDGTDESTIEIDDTGAETDITIETDGDVTVNDDDGGTVEIGDGYVDVAGKTINIDDEDNGSIRVANGSVRLDGSNDIDNTADGMVDIDDGTVDVAGESIEIGDGGKGAIHDIDVTTDADGHITDISLKRRSDVTL